MSPSQLASQVDSALQSCAYSQGSESDLLVTPFIGPVPESPELGSNFGAENEWSARFEYALGQDDALVFPQLGAMYGGDFMQPCVGEVKV